MKRPRRTRGTAWTVGLIVGLLALARAGDAVAEDQSPAETRPQAVAADRTTTGDQAERVPSAIHDDWGYYDEPPLDYYERRWRWYTRQVKPQRFARRDLRRRFGYDPPFVRGAPPSWRDPYGYVPLPYEYDLEGQAYIQGRHDERRFRDWKERHDRGKRAYAAAMSEGVRLFREADYAGALGRFVLAAKLNQGDPASRLHAGYAMVALGNYDDAVLIIRRAMQLQPKIPYLPLDIRSEYGPKVDFDAHRQRLGEAADAAEDDSGLWMLLGFYHYFSDDAPAAFEALAKAKELAPRDPIITDLHEAARLMTPSTARRKN